MTDADLLPRPHRRRTVWARDSLPLVPDRFRPLFTVVLPLKYLLMALFGLAATLQRIPTFDRVATAQYGDYWAAGVGILALASLVTLVFRAGVELYATIALGFVLLSYPIFLFALAIEGDGNRWALAVGVLTFILLPGWRAYDLVTEERARRRAEQIAAAIRKAAGNATD